MHIIPGRIAIIAGIFSRLADCSLYLFVFFKVNKEVMRMEILLGRQES